MSDRDTQRPSPPVEMVTHELSVPDRRSYETTMSLVLDELAKIRGLLESAQKSDETIERRLDNLERGQARQSNALQYLLVHGEVGNGLDGKTVLHVEDDAQVRAAIDRALRGAGAEVHSCRGIVEAKTWLATANVEVDAAIIDSKLPDGFGESLVVELRQTRPELRCILVTGYQDTPDSRYAHDTLRKPFMFDQLRAAILGRQ